MQDYFVAKLIGSVPKVDSRKRLQKMIYLLERLPKSPLKFDYFLHYYGPYSRELADVVMQLETLGIVKEEPRGAAYECFLTKQGKQLLANFEKSPTGSGLEKGIQPFIETFKKLNQDELWVLELASTVSYFYQDDWNSAKKLTANFKHVNSNDKQLYAAMKLARDFCCTAG